ncbi:MAG: TIGR03862 family flavoprotein [Betaproteobacteria bacterium]
MTHAAVIGGGPAGLMAAEVLAQAGVQVHVYDAMPSVGRKFLLAGKGGLNLTHSEPRADFEARYGARQPEVAALLQAFDANALRAWVHALGVQTFVGSSGRVFPSDMKAAPLLRAWLHRLRHPQQGEPVQLHMRHRWCGWADGQDPTRGCVFDTPQGRQTIAADVVVLALGGASWPQLGSNGAWVPSLIARGVAVAPLLPANCGFDRDGGWSPHFAGRFAGQPFKSVVLRLPAAAGPTFERKGEFVATGTGIEGSLVYAASALLRDAIAARGSAVVEVDLLPDFSADKVVAQVTHPRGSRSLSSHLKSRLGIDGIKSGLLHEVLTRQQMADPTLLAATIKSVPLRLSRARPVAEAISSAGGVRFDAMDATLMLSRCPGVFCAGEMLDWEAPTGGYLLTAAMASGRVAAQGALRFLGCDRPGVSGAQAG